MTQINVTEDQLCAALNEYLGGQQGVAAARHVASKYGVSPKQVEKPVFRVTARGIQKGHDDKFPTYGAGGYLWPKSEPATNMLTATQVERVREQEAAGHLIVIDVVNTAEEKPAQPQQNQQNRR